MDLQNIALKVGITCDTKDRTKRQIKGFITKLYEGIIEDLVDYFSWNLSEKEAIENTKATNDKVRNSHDKSRNKGLTTWQSKTKKAPETPAETSGDTDSANETQHLQLGPGQIVNFVRSRKEGETYKKCNKEEIKDDNEERIDREIFKKDNEEEIKNDDDERIDFKVTSRKVSIVLPKE